MSLGPDPAGGAPGAPRIRPFLGAARQPPPAEPAPAEVPPRPYVLTAGRVRAGDPAIGIETQVTARRVDERGALPRLAPELEAIVALCAQPVSVAEIAAHLRLHLSVARILVGDLKAAGYLDVHTRGAGTPHAPDTILRVMRGLRAIT